MQKKVIFLSALFVLILGTLFTFAQFSKDGQNITDSVLSGVEATIYKSPSCGCCVGYNAEIRGLGVKTKIVEIENMQEIKDKYNIPKDMESCHTTIIGNYFIEGHMPFEAVEKLLTEKPDINGIALPNMPAGTPGMPGIKSGPYNIYQIKDGISSLYISI